MCTNFVVKKVEVKYHTWPPGTAVGQIIMRMCRILFTFKHFKKNKIARKWHLFLNFVAWLYHRFQSPSLLCMNSIKLLWNCYECFAFNDKWDCWLFIRALRHHWNKTSDILPQRHVCVFTTSGFYWLLPGCNTVTSVKSMMSDAHKIDRGRDGVGWLGGGFVPLSWIWRKC